MAGKELIDLVKFPLPSFRYSLSSKELFSPVYSFPPLTTYKSGFPSPFASKNTASTSSQDASLLNNAVSAETNEPFFCWIINTQVDPLPHRHKNHPTRHHLHHQQLLLALL